MKKNIWKFLLSKKKTFTDRLKQVIGLTPDEEKQLKIACVSANPKGKGLHEWFQKRKNTTEDPIYNN